MDVRKCVREKRSGEHRQDSVRVAELNIRFCATHAVLLCRMHSQMRAFNDILSQTAETGVNSRMVVADGAASCESTPYCAAAREVLEAVGSGAEEHSPVPYLSCSVLYISSFPDTPRFSDLIRAVRQAGSPQGPSDILACQDLMYVMIGIYVELFFDLHRARIPHLGAPLVSRLEPTPMNTSGTV